MSSMTKRQKETALIVLAAVFLLALAAYSYFMVYAPARDGALQAEQSLSSERDVLMALQTQIKELPEGEKISTSELQQKVSIEPLSELIVLQIEQAELLSNSLVTNIAITEEPVVLPVPVEGLENLQEVQTTVSIEVADYKNITSFIKEIEAMDRILIVDSIDFGALEEVTTADQERELIEVTLGFSAYFRPDLIALLDTLPKVDAPPPAGKVNPLAQNDGTDLSAPDEAVPAEEAAVDVEVDVDVDIEEDSAAVPAEPNPNVAGAQTAGYHKVQKGDTLFSIAVQYFNSRDGEALIQQANGKTDKTVMLGETLIIPERR
ncbi:type IV pilus assembly protein PilO [Planomicrobium koreense]|uniref:Type IV pilus assembly protein PilO n=1 Tax=Planococcus koreensis TaxID=112331 RepID=A0A7W8CUZ4_9BACL|nr:LysM peptidoglycan-binding domain-containing protein [Planococcus koreensis]MBB5180737.1 type IV pilus assembly protein PilO [Planococcus koreensis]